eukprot:724117-Rhodomonas_salina.1
MAAAGRRSAPKAAKSTAFDQESGCVSLISHRVSFSSPSSLSPSLHSSLRRSPLASLATPSTARAHMSLTLSFFLPPSRPPLSLFSPLSPTVSAPPLTHTPWPDEHSQRRHAHVT